MPNAKVLTQKKEIVAELTRKMKAAQSGVFVDYRGISVAADTKLRAEMRKNNVEYSVIKNTLARFAIKELGFDELDPILNGTTALALSMDDSILPSRLVGEFAKKNPKIYKIKAGFVDGKVVDAATIERLADLPSKDVLVAMVLGTMNAPIAALARAIQAIAEQQGAPAKSDEPAAEAETAEVEAAPAEEPAATEETAPVEEPATGEEAGQ